MLDLFFKCDLVLALSYALQIKIAANVCTLGMFIGSAYICQTIWFKNGHFYEVHTYDYEVHTSALNSV